MGFKKVLMSSAVVLGTFGVVPAMAAEAAGITYSGAVDFSYDWSPNDAVLGRVFDTENDAFVFHQANLSAAKEFDGGVGVGVNVILGKDANVVSGDLLDGDDFDLTQAYLTKSFGNLSVKAGRYVTLAGMETINPAGNLNASRSVLFFAQPRVHEGVRATYKVSDALAVTLGLNNAQFATSCGPSLADLGAVGGIGGAIGGAGIPPVLCTQSLGLGGFIGEGDPSLIGQRDNNTDTTVEAQVAFTPSKQLSVFLTGYSGNEDPSFGGALGGEGGNRSADYRYDTLDLVVNFNLTEMLYLGLNADYFNREVDGGHLEAKGVAGYVGVKVAPNMRVALRSEYAAIEAGSGGGDAILTENTLTFGYTVTSNLEVLLEGRHDRIRGNSADGNEFFFPIDGNSEDDQYTGTVKAILKF